MRAANCSRGEAPAAPSWSTAEDDFGVLLMLMHLDHWTIAWPFD